MSSRPQIRAVSLTELANVRLSLPNEAANVSLVREALSGVAEAVAMERGQLDDIRTAVSEACNNVVLHAYGGERGPLELEVFVRGRSVEVVVRDRGIGIRPRLAEETRDPGVGLAVMRALCATVEFSGAGDGTAVRMSFPASDGGLTKLNEPAVNGRLADLPYGDVVVSVSPPDLAPGVFSRLAGALSARARFSIDRLSDAQLVTDALAATSDPVTLALSCSERRLDLRLGPLEPGQGERVLAESSVDDLIARLVDEIDTERRDGHEVLHLALTDER